MLIQTADCQSRQLPDYNKPFDIFTAQKPLAGGVVVTLDPVPAGVTRACVVLAPGSYAITATLAATGQRIGSQRVVVRADTFSNMVLVRTP